MPSLNAVTVTLRAHGLSAAAAELVWDVLQHESIGSASDVRDAVGCLLVSEYDLPSADVDSVALELFHTLGIWQGGAASAPPQRAAPSAGLFLSSFEWKREFKTDKERYELPYSFELTDGRGCLELAQTPFGPEGFASTVWDSSIVLARMLEHRGESLLGCRCIELGAGCGLVGLAAAALGANVVLTDLPVNLRLLRANARANAKASLGGVPRVQPLAWGERLLDEGFDMVVATDVFYAREAMPALLETLVALAGPRTSVLLAAGRNRHAADDFFALARINFEIEQLDREALHPIYQCGDVDVWSLRVKLGRST